MKRPKRILGFSLVELVIVIVIIGIIAAIAIPRVSRAGEGAGDAALRSNLATLRSAIDLFAAEHNGTFPGNSTDDDSDFVSQLTSKTDIEGTVGVTAGTHVYGPYLRGGMPVLPVGAKKGQNAVDVQATGPTYQGTGDIGWAYNKATGDIIANCADTEKDGSEVKYNTY